MDARVTWSGMRLGWGRDDGAFFSRALDVAQQECREPGSPLLCMGLFSRFFVQALPCTAEGALCRIRDTRSLVLALTERIDPTPTHHALGWLACLGLGRLDPHPQLAATALLDVEGAGLAHEIAELVVAVGAHVEVGEKIGDLPADLTEQHPAIFAFDL